MLESPVVVGFIFGVVGAYINGGGVKREFIAVIRAGFDGAAVSWVMSMFGFHVGYSAVAALSAPLILHFAKYELPKLARLKWERIRGTGNGG